MTPSSRHQGTRGVGDTRSCSQLRLRGELESITDEGQGVREVFDVHRGEVNEVMFADPIVRLDLNTPEEYEAAREKYGA